MAKQTAQETEEIETFSLRVLTPQREVYLGEVVGVCLSGARGELELLPRHEPTLTPLRIGPMVIQEPVGVSGNTQEVTVAVHGGFLDMNGTSAVVYASSAEFLNDLDLERAREAEARARERLAKVALVKGGGAPVDIDRAQQALLRALLRLRLGEMAASQASS